METIKIKYNWYNESTMTSGTATIDSGLTRLPTKGWARMAEAIVAKRAQERHRIVLDIWVVDPEIS